MTGYFMECYTGLIGRGIVQYERVAPAVYLAFHLLRFKPVKRLHRLTFTGCNLQIKMAKNLTFLGIYVEKTCHFSSSTTGFYSIKYYLDQLYEETEF